MTFAALFALTFVPAAAMTGRGQAELHPDPAGAVEEKFIAFVQEHGRAYGLGSKEYNMRLAHFKERLAAVEAQNRQPGRSWTAAVNLLADHTPEELAMLRGYRRSARASARASSLAFTSETVRKVDVNSLPENFTWREKLASMADVRDQGACGSCWAIASTTVLRAHAELYQQDRSFSTQQIVECTPNPQQCGGTGGCKGATAELAMDYASRSNLVTEEEHTYKASDTKCPAQMRPPTPNLRSGSQHGVSLPQVLQSTKGGNTFGMTGSQKLPENLVAPLLLAVYEKGPVVVSVAATDGWSMYGSGIMKACDKGAVINHAVVLVGYGKEGQQGFYQIQNSWGKLWGEQGFIRLHRHGDHDEGAYCGWDEKPSDGTGCKGGPSKVWTCGSCGILYDSVVPNFALSKEGFFSKFSRNSTSGIFTQISA